MKFQSFLITAFLLFSMHSFAQSGDSCKVLLKEISGTYKGSCKNGLADGKGIAGGIDTYKGSFKNGLPDGKGVYTYKNGNVFSGNFTNGLKNGKGEFIYLAGGKTMTVIGYWQDGEYSGTSRPDELYRINNISAIEHYSITKTAGEPNLVEISFEKVWKKYIPRDLEMTLSSGYYIEQNLKILLQDCHYPLSCTLHFTIPLSGGVRECNFSFTLLKPGKYAVFISNNS